jgi:hypothetical protein
MSPLQQLMNDFQKSNDNIMYTITISLVLDYCHFETVILAYKNNTINHYPPLIGNNINK